MSVRQDLKLEVEDFVYEYKDRIIKYLESNIISDYVECGDCGHEIYVGDECCSVEVAEAVLDIIARDIHSQEQLIHLTIAGDLAWNILNGNNKTVSSTHKQYDDAMKGL